MRCGSRAVAVRFHGDGELGGHRRCVLLKDGPDLHVGARHEELIVLDGHAAADDLPLLEVVALFGRGGQGDLRAGRSGGRSCGASAVSVITDGDGVGGGGNNAVFPQRLDFGIPVHCVGIAYLVLRAADLPSLELLIGGSGEAAGGQDVICPCLDGNRLHAAAAAVAVEGDSKVCERLSFTHRDLRIGAGKVVVILRIANEVITSGQVFNLDTGAGGVDSFALRTVFHRCIHAGDLAVAAALGSGRDTDQAVRRFLRGFADAPRRGHGIGAAVRPFAGLGCDANGVIARVRGGVAGDVHCGGIIAAHGRGTHRAVIGICSRYADVGLCGIGGHGRRVLLEDCLDLYIAVRHGELVVGDYKSCRRFDLPLLEVIALVGRSAQGDLRTGNSLCGRCGSRSVAAAGHGDGVLRGCGRHILLKDGLDLHVVVRHGELIVLDAHAAADDLPLLEVIALVGRSAQCDLRTGNSLYGRCRSRAVAAAGHGDGMLGRRRWCILLEDCLDLYIAVRHGELVVGDYKSCRRFDLPLLEVVALVGRSGQGDRRTGRSFCMRGGSRAVAAAGHGDGILGGRGLGYRNRQLLRIATRAVFCLDGEAGSSRCGGRAADLAGGFVQRQAVGPSAAANAPFDGRSAVGGQGLAVSLAHLAVRQCVRNDIRCGGRGIDRHRAGSGEQTVMCGGGNDSRPACHGGDNAVLGNRGDSLVVGAPAHLFVGGVLRRHRGGQGLAATHIEGNAALVQRYAGNRDHIGAVINRDGFLRPVSGLVGRDDLICAVGIRKECNPNCVVAAYCLGRSVYRDGSKVIIGDLHIFRGIIHFTILNAIDRRGSGVNHNAACCPEIGDIALCVGELRINDVLTVRVQLERLGVRGKVSFCASGLREVLIGDQIADLHRLTAGFRSGDGYSLLRVVKPCGIVAFEAIPYGVLTFNLNFTLRIPCRRPLRRQRDALYVFISRKIRIGGSGKHGFAGTAPAAELIVGSGGRLHTVQHALLPPDAGFIADTRAAGSIKLYGIRGLRVSADGEIVLSLAAVVPRAVQRHLGGFFRVKARVAGVEGVGIYMVGIAGGVVRVLR